MSTKTPITMIQFVITSSEAAEDMRHVRQLFLGPVDHDIVNRIANRVAARGLELAGRVEVVTLEAVAPISGYSLIGEAIDEHAAQFAAPGEPAPTQADPTEGRLNDLERSIRNIGRNLNQLVEAVGKLASQQPAVARQMPAPVTYQPTDAPAIVVDRVDDGPRIQRDMPNPADIPRARLESPSLNPVQAKSLELGRPVVGTPCGWTGPADAMSMPINPHARNGSGKTPEMISGQLGVIGKMPTSAIEQIVGVDADGKAIIRSFELPRVGDSLTPPSAKSDL